MLGEYLVGAQDVGCGAHLAAAKPIFRNSQEEEEVLHQAHCRPFRENRQNVKPELSGELEPRENQNPCQQAPEFGEPLRFVRFLPAKELEKLQILDFPPEFGVSANRVVIGEGYGIETALFGPVQDVENADARLLIIGRRRSVDVKIDPAPGEILRRRCVGGDSTVRCGRGSLPRCGGQRNRGIGLRRRGGAVAAPAYGRNRESPSGAETANYRQNPGSRLLPGWSTIPYVEVLLTSRQPIVR
jgi:hypothetical protein